MIAMNLEGQVALVTGGSGMIGSAICRSLASQGASLVVHYHNRKSDAEKLCQELRTIGNRAEVVGADIADRKQAEAMVQNASHVWDRLDILINNAGWTQRVAPKDLDALTDDLIDQTLRLKIHAPLYCFRASQRFLEESGQGHVVNITSAAGIAARGSSTVYAAANAALTTLTRNWAMTFSPKIRVNAVAPGFVDSGFAFEKNGDVARRVADNNHRQRVVDASEIAKAVEFLCLNTAITGEELLVDAGIARLGKKG